MLMLLGFETNDLAVNFALPSALFLLDILRLRTTSNETNYALFHEA